MRGLELGVVGRITPAWQLMAGYTLLDGKIIASQDRTGAGTAASPYLYAQGKTLANTPRHSASLWSTYSFLDHWEAGGGLVYSADRTVNNFESAQIDGYTRIDATLAYKQKKLRHPAQSAEPDGPAIFRDRLGRARDTGQRADRDRVGRVSVLTN
ncbi:TonB-dependent receptor domain-containing protein [Undibacterium arcticum]